MIPQRGCVVLDLHLRRVKINVTHLKQPLSAGSASLRRRGGQAHEISPCSKQFLISRRRRLQKNWLESAGPTRGEHRTCVKMEAYYVRSLVWHFSVQKHLKPERFR
jgi:hypothetical protein